MSIKELLDAESRVTLAVTPADLKEFALELVAEAVASWEAANGVREREESRLFTGEAARELGVTVNTLWRWVKEGYLKPAGYVGRRPYYLKSQLDNLGRGGRP